MLPSSEQGPSQGWELTGGPEETSGGLEVGAGVSRRVASLGPCWDGTRAAWTARGSHRQNLEHLLLLLLFNVIAKQRFLSGCFETKKGSGF